MLFSICFIFLTFDDLNIRLDEGYYKGYKMHDLAKLVTNLVQKFPNSEDFIKEIENTNKPDKEKGEYFFEIGDNLLSIDHNNRLQSLVDIFHN